MAKRSRFTELLRTITKDVMSHPRDLTRYYVEKLGISRVSVNKYIKRLEAEGWIARSGPSTHPVFSPGYNRRLFGYYPLAGLEEDRVWENDFKPYISVPINIQNIANHGFTEILNNSIDHSEGAAALIFVAQNEKMLQIIISDNGVGIFVKITKALDLPDMRQALFELSKGKLTTDPEKHTGEGVFFTSRMFDMFEISANNLKFNHFSNATHDSLLETDEKLPKEGTAVSMAISLSSKRTTEEVFNQFTEAPNDYDFSRTVVPMRLARFGDEQLVSRSQAKRLIARFEKFRVVILDFSEIQQIGQAFSDELFRVYRNSHPNIELSPTNMTEQVERMWLRATAH